MRRPLLGEDEMSQQVQRDQTAHTRHALSECRLGEHIVRNRIAFAACVNNLGRNDRITAEQVEFYAARARGGVGVVVTEGMSVHGSSVPNHTIPLIFRRSLLPGLERIASAIHAYNTVAIAQLWHVGRNALWSGSTPLWAPSPVPDPYSGSFPHPVTEREIEELLDGYTSSAVHASEAGFDGIEIHAAHGYLVAQFLSPEANRRVDRWGGALENRVRFLHEVVTRVRASVPMKFVIGLKLSADEWSRGGITLDDTLDIVTLLLDARAIDYFAISQGNFSPSLERHVPDSRFPVAPGIELAREVRKCVAGQSTVMALGRIPDLGCADRLVADGAADFVGIVRPLIADPGWVNKGGVAQKPRPCVFCNKCWRDIHASHPVTCSYAPMNTSPTVRADARGFVRHTVHVVGAGPAGLEAARVAAEAGHRVTLHEARTYLGGHLRDEASIPGREEIAGAVEWMIDAAVLAGVAIESSSPVDAALAAGWEEDSIVVQATGAVATAPAITGSRSRLTLFDAVQAATERSLGAGPVVVIDEIGDEPVYAAAEFFAALGHDVHLLTRRPQIGHKLAYVSQIGVYRRLDALGVPIYTAQVPARAVGGILHAVNYFSGVERPLAEVGTIVWAGVYALPSPLLDVGVRPRVVIGDAVAPREIGVVLREAHALASNLAAAISAPA